MWNQKLACHFLCGLRQTIWILEFQILYLWSWMVIPLSPEATTCLGTSFWRRTPSSLALYKALQFLIPIKVILTNNRHGKQFWHYDVNDSMLRGLWDLKRYTQEERTFLLPDKVSECDDWNCSSHPVTTCGATLLPLWSRSEHTFTSLRTMAYNVQNYLVFWHPHWRLHSSFTLHQIINVLII